MRSIARAGSVGEAGVGASEATDLASRPLAAKGGVHIQSC